MKTVFKLKSMKKLILLVCVILCFTSVYAENAVLDLIIEQKDVRLEKDENSGYHLYVRK